LPFMKMAVMICAGSGRRRSLGRQQHPQGHAEGVHVREGLGEAAGLVVVELWGHVRICPQRPPRFRSQRL